MSLLISITENICYFRTVSGNRTQKVKGIIELYLLANFSLVRIGAYYRRQVGGSDLKSDSSNFLTPHTMAFLTA